MTISKAERAFLPAAGRDWLLALHDPLTKLLGMDTAHRALLDQAALQPEHRVLDIGCDQRGIRSAEKAGRAGKDRRAPAVLSGNRPGGPDGDAIGEGPASTWAQTQAAGGRTG